MYKLIATDLDGTLVTDDKNLTDRTIENVKKALKKNVKIIVIACGTATSQAIDILQQKFEIPIIGIIKPTVEYIKEKEYKEKKRRVVYLLWCSYQYSRRLQNE